MSEKTKTNLWDKVPFLTRLKNIKHIEVIVAVIFVAVLAFNLIGDTIRDILDPKSKVR